MNKSIAFVKLDLVTVKPYLTWKNLMIFTAVGLLLVVTSGSGLTAIAMVMAYAALYVSYPFAVGEKNGIDALYVTLSIKRNTVVLGRYLFMLFVDIVAALFAYAFACLVLTVMQKEFNALETLLVTGGLFWAYSLIQTVQLPIYFKLGYAKAKAIAYLPFVGLPLAVILLSSFLKSHLPMEQVLDYFASNPIMIALIVAGVWTVAMLLSFRVSIIGYNKRDF